MNITVTIKNIYGNDRIYPACEESQMFASLTGTKTLSHHAIRIIKRLGYTVTVITTTL